MVEPNRDRRPPLAVGMELASQVISVSLMMALPAGAGYWGDSKLGTAPWLMTAGAVLGLLGGMAQIFRGINRTDGKRRNGDGPDK